MSAPRVGRVLLGRQVRRWSFAGACLAACGSPRLAVPSHPHPDFAQAERVTSPPPPARIERLASEPPAPGCRWVDGQWVWASQRWDWRPGGWILPPEGCRYSAPNTTWVASEGAGALYYKRGRWYSVAERKVCPEPPPCPGSTLPGSASPTLSP